MPDFGLMGQSLIVSALAAGSALLLFARLGRAAGGRAESVGWLLALAAGIYSGCGVLGEWPRWPAPEDRDRFLVVLLPLTLAAEGVAAGARSGWVARLLRWAVAAAAAPILLYRSTYLADIAGPGSAEWSPALAAAILLLLGAALAGQWELMAAWQRRSSPPAAATVLVLALLAAGLTVMLSGYYRGGLFALPIAGALVGASLAAYLCPAGGSANVSPADKAPAVAIGVVGLFSILVIGRFFGALPGGAMVALLAAPALAWTAELPAIRSLRPAAKVIVACVAVLLPLVAIVVRAQLDFNAALATSSRPPGSAAGSEQISRP